MDKINAEAENLTSQISILKSQFSNLESHIVNLNSEILRILVGYFKKKYKIPLPRGQAGITI